MHKYLNLAFGDLDTWLPAYILSVVPSHCPTSNLAHSCRPSHVSSDFFDFACVSSVTSPCTPRQICLLCSLNSHFTLYIAPLGPMSYYMLVTVHLLLFNVNRYTWEKVLYFYSSWYPSWQKWTSCLIFWGLWMYFCFLCKNWGNITLPLIYLSFLA